MEMDLASKDLFALMANIYPKTLKVPFLRTVFKKIASAISYIHSKGIVHNDIKLENIFLIDDYEPVLADFGFAKESKPVNFSE
jgi:serine/threonine protein kinase